MVTVQIGLSWWRWWLEVLYSPFSKSSSTHIKGLFEEGNLPACDFQTVYMPTSRFGSQVDFIDGARKGFQKTSFLSLNSIYFLV